MIQRLRALLAHARAGHRIGCETCVWQEAEAEPGFTDRLDAAIDRMDRQGLGVPYTPKSKEPVVAPAPARGTDTGVPATGSRIDSMCRRNYQPDYECEVHPRPDPAHDEPADRTPFREVIDDLTDGCGCACHVGTGYRSSCDHCFGSVSTSSGSRPHTLYVADPDALRRSGEL